MPKSSRTRPDAELVQRLQRGDRRRRLLDQDALGDLQPQVDRVEAGAGEDLGDRSRRRSRWATWRAERLTATSNGRGVGAQLVPVEDLAAGALLHPAADRLDQAAVLGDRDEVAGVEQAALGVAASGPAPRGR